MLYLIGIDQDDFGSNRSKVILIQARLRGGFACAGSIAGGGNQVFMINDFSGL